MLIVKPPTVTASLFMNRQLIFLMLHAGLTILDHEDGETDEIYRVKSSVLRLMTIRVRAVFFETSVFSQESRQSSRLLPVNFFFKSHSVTDESDIYDDVHS